jgi:methyl-accepting chemotaxis protein
MLTPEPEAGHTLDERSQQLIAALAGHFAHLASRADLADLTRPMTFDGALEPSVAELLRHVNEFLGRVQRDFADLGRISNDASRAAAENSYLLKRIAASAAEQSDQTAQIAAAVHETAQASGSVAESSDAIRRLMSEVDRASHEASSALERSLERLDELHAQADRALENVKVVVDHSRQIQHVVDVIDDISTRTNLLAINASIEAAHAGERGRGFAVVAAEIKRLADSTKQSTKEIASLIKNVGTAIEAAQLATQRNFDDVTEVNRESLLVREDLTKMTGVVESSADQVTTIAAAVEEQSATLRAISENIETLSRHAEEASKHAATAGQLQLGEINSDVFAIVGAYKLGTFFDRMRTWVEAFARECETVFDDAVDRGRVRLEELLDLSYEEITPATAHTLSRIFNVSRLGPRGFDPPKYRTKTDHLFDTALMPVCDRCADHDPKIVYASVGDINGFSIMSSRALRQDITGDPQRDLIGNRIKRFFDDPLGLRAMRVGLGSTGLSVPKRAPRSAFDAARVDLSRPAGPREWLLQTYARDTGKIYDDLAFPVYCKDKRWGAVRVGFEPTL